MRVYAAAVDLRRLTFRFWLSGAYRETTGNLGKHALWARGTVNVRFLRQEQVWQSNAQVNRESDRSQVTERGWSR